MDELLTTLKQNHESKNAYHAQTMKTLKTEYDKLESWLEKMYDDKLDESITQEQYDRTLKRYKTQQEEILRQMDNHRLADESYYLNADRIMKVARNASNLFEKATFEEKQKLLRFLLSNSAMDGENLVPSIKKPFDILFECQKTKDWLPLKDLFCNHKLEFDISLSDLKIAFDEIGLKQPKLAFAS